MARFALATGLREANVTGLQWSQVDLARRVAWIHADQAKNGKHLGVPLNNEAVVLLRKQMGNHPDYVFTYRSRPVKKCNTKAWRKALRKAASELSTGTTYRHTWAPAGMSRGTPLHALQELGGWSDIRMVRRYAHLAPEEHLSEYADRLCRLREVVVTESATHAT